MSQSNLNYNLVNVLIYSTDGSNNKYYLLGKLSNGNVWTSIQESPIVSDGNNPVNTGSRAVIEATNNWGYGFQVNFGPQSSVVRSQNIRTSQNLRASQNLIPVRAGMPMPNGTIRPLPTYMQGLGMLGSNVMYRPPFMRGGSYTPLSIIPPIGITSPLSEDSVVIKNALPGTQFSPLLTNPYMKIPKGYNGPLGPIPKINVRLNNLASLNSNSNLNINRRSNNFNYRNSSSFNWIYNSLRNTTYTQHNVNSQNIVSYIINKMPYDTTLPQRFQSMKGSLSNRLSNFSQVAWVSETELRNLKNTSTINARSIPSLNNDLSSWEFCQLLKQLNI
ncbi:hypothetical protein CPAV1605_1096 [seawater metagenome]|uniref:Uncharacterized protein n=1 Tax=seawater metagenome TaxID=1561972 RepID=A0A5E8CLV1_9ZZZZ